MKYLNSSFSISMPGNKGHWPWDDKGNNVTPEPPMISFLDELTPEDWNQMTKHLIESSKALQEAADKTTSSGSRGVQDHVAPERREAESKQSLERRIRAARAALRLSEEADAIKDHGGEA